MRPLFLADENIDADLVHGLTRRVEGIDIVRVQDVGLRTLDDPTVLRWAAAEGRILISRDIRTIPGFASERIDAGQVMPGVFVLHSRVPMAAALDDLALIAGASEAEEWVGRVVFLPLR